jgi:transcriptional regulator with XRE-family HTH domain
VIDEGALRSVGAAVRRRRLERDWTLDDAAARLGVSRRLLVQIEAGEGNPSLSTLLAIAAGFDIALVDLLADTRQPAITVQPDSGNAPVLWAGPSGGHGRLLVASSGLELWDWVLHPGEERCSDAHRPGSREALTVTAGSLTIEVAGADRAVLHRGQAAAFAADVDHRYANEASHPTRFTLSVYEAS